jgi:hypothetical protein
MPVLPRPTSLMMTYLPIFSGSSARALGDLTAAVGMDVFIKTGTRHNTGPVQGIL